MRAVTLLFQRLLVLGLGALTVWVIAFVVFHAADRRLPLAFALALTYALAAYVILPRAIRLGLRILSRGHLPSYTTTGDGLPGDPVNLALIGTRDQLKRAFAAAGWHQADRLSLSSSWRMALAFVLNNPIRRRRSARFICSAAARTSASSGRSAQARASAITSASGRSRSSRPRPSSTRQNFGATRRRRRIASR